MNTLPLIVRVTAIVDDEDLHPLDENIPGDWDIYLPAEAKDWSEGDQATAALDEFHESVAIKVLEDFTIEVFNENNEQLFEDYDED